MVVALTALYVRCSDTAQSPQALFPRRIAPELLMNMALMKVNRLTASGHYMSDIIPDADNCHATGTL